MKKPLVKIYGERNTGTNYLSRLIRLNLDVDELSGIAPKPIVRLQNRLPGREWVKDWYFTWSFASNLGWKHMKVKAPSRLDGTIATKSQVLFVTLTKNPYSWLLSLHKRPYHGDVNEPKPGLEKFLQQPYSPKGRDNLGTADINPIQLWNAKNRSYVDLKSDFPVVSIRYEDLLGDPQETLANICNEWELNWDRSQFKNYSESTKDSDKDANFYRDYYLGEQWRSKLTPEAIEIINRYVDHDLMRHYGYQKIEQSSLNSNV